MGGNTAAPTLPVGTNTLRREDAVKPKLDLAALRRRLSLASHQQTGPEFGHMLSVSNHELAHPCA